MKVYVKHLNQRRRLRKAITKYRFISLDSFPFEEAKQIAENILKAFPGKICTYELERIHYFSGDIYVSYVISLDAHLPAFKGVKEIVGTSFYTVGKL